MGKSVFMLSLFLLVSFALPAQHSETDSLKKLLKKNIADTSRLNILIELGNAWLKTSADSAIRYHSIAVEKAGNKHSLKQIKALNELGWDYYKKQDYQNAKKNCHLALRSVNSELKKSIKKKQAANLTKIKLKICENLGGIHTRTGEYRVAREYYLSGAQAAHRLKEYDNQVVMYNNVAKTYYLEGFYPKALDYCLKALKVSEESGNKKGVASNLGNIGIIFKEQGDNKKALSYFLRALKIHRELNNTESQATVLGNIGVVYQMMKDYDKALDYFKASVNINERLNDSYSLIYNYNNIGILYQSLKKHNESLVYFNKSIALLNSDVEDPFVRVFTYNSVASVYVNLGQFAKARQYSKLAEKLAAQTGSKNLLESNYRIQHELYEKTGEYKLSLQYFKKHIELRDSTKSEENLRKTIQKEAQFEYHKKEVADSVAFVNASRLKNAELAKKSAEIARKNIELRADRNQRYMLYGGLGLLVLFGAFMFNRFKLSQKQNLIINRQKQEVENQKMLVEEKQKEIIDSINYAKRIQTALLPLSRIIDSYVENFVLYLPKDIVAGDFYWFMPTGNGFLLAAVDCTGHGVPGAMVSVIANNSLNRSVKEFHLINPADILNKSREIMLEELAKSDEDVKDGMDISLCYIEDKQNGEIALTWSGANNPLWIMRQNETVMEEWKPQKQSIGKGELQKLFISRDTILRKNDCIYLFTDGYADQFGGTDAISSGGKKFKHSRLMQLITESQQLSMLQQKQILAKKFEDWKGQFEQIDDVCVLGVRL